LRYKITKIEKQTKRDRYNIYLDGVYIFSLSSRVLADCGLEKNQILTDKQIEELKSMDELGKAYTRATLILSYRANTEGELRTKLLKNFDKIAVEKAISKLMEQGFINDADFAERYVEQSKKGKRLVKMELLKKDVDKKIIEKVVNQKDEEVEFENARKLAEKVFIKYQKEPKQIIKQKIYERLTRRGFSYDIFKQVVSEMDV